MYFRFVNWSCRVVSFVIPLPYYFCILFTKIYTSTFYNGQICRGCRYLITKSSAVVLLWFNRLQWWSTGYHVICFILDNNLSPAKKHYIIIKTLSIILLFPSIANVNHMTDSEWAIVFRAKMLSLYCAMCCYAVGQNMISPWCNHLRLTQE